MKKAIIEHLIELRRKGASIFEQWAFLQQSYAYEKEILAENICAIFPEWKNYIKIIHHTEKLVQEKDHRKIAEFVEYLGHSGESAIIPYLVPHLENTYPIVREKVIRALGRLGQEAIPFLLRCLEHPYLQDQKRAIIALGELKAKEAEPFIRFFLQSSFSEIRIEAWKALGKILEEEELCWENAFQDPEAYVRRTAIEELGRKQNAHYFDFFLKALGDPYYEVRQRAIMALGKLGDLRAVPILKEHLKDLSFHVRIECSTALVSLGEKREGFCFLKNYLQHESSSIRAYTVKSLGTLTDQEVLPLLTLVLKDSEKLVRYALARALELQGVKAIPSLMLLMEDVDEGVRHTALYSTNQIQQTIQEGTERNEALYQI